jgi:hypothetical protein
MGLPISIDWLRANGIDERTIREIEGRAQQADRSEAVRERLEIGPTPKAKPTIAKANGYDSKLECDFAAQLAKAQWQRLIERWWHQPIGLRLATRCFYYPDFLVMPCNGPLTLVETKGKWYRDEAKVKSKVAAEMYPCFRWLLVLREGRHGWNIREIDQTGVGRSSISVPWITGG